jgi:penicillin-binding protein 2
MLKPDILAKYARGFGFNAPTGIDLNDEKGGLIPTAAWYKKRYGIPWQAGESLSVAIGQGANQVTPLQMVMAYASIANGGILYKPFCVDKIVSVDGAIIKDFVPTAKRRVPVSAENVGLLKECFSMVVNSPHGTGGRARLPNIEVAGKTGTAQVVALSREDRTGQTRALKDHAWFVAFAPKDRPRIAVVVLVEHGGHGGSAAAPLAKKVLSKFFELEEGGHV